MAEDRFRKLKLKLVPNIIFMWFEKSGLPLNQLRTFEKTYTPVLRERSFEKTRAEKLENAVRRWVIERARSGIGTT